MPDFFTQAALTLAGITMAVSIAAAFGLKFLMERLRNLNQEHFWLKTLGDTLYIPIFWITLIYGLFFSLDAFIRDDRCPLSYPIFVSGRDLFSVFVFAFIAFRWKKQVTAALLERAKRSKSKTNDQALITVTSKVLTIFFFVLIGFAVLDIFHVPINALLTFGGIGSLAISWAAKDVIANFFGGMMIFINQPFYVGDWIMSPNKNFEGVVEEIGWYMTRIRTFERRPTYIPNAMITDAIVENPGRMYNRRIKTTVGLRYEDIDKVEAVVSDIETMLRSHKEIDQNQLLFVHFVEFGSYSLDINIYTFTKTTGWGEYRKVQQEVLMKISEIIRGHGAAIAFPTQTLHVQAPDEKS